MPVGDAVAATDSENNEITYSLGGTDAGHFTIDATGQLMTSGASGLRVDGAATP